MRLTNRDLQRMFHKLNKKWFNGQIAYHECRFEKIRDEGLHLGDSLDDKRRDARKILINKDLKSHPILAELCLVHEMAHAALPEYDGHHGIRWHAEIDRLYKAGAYDDLL